MTSSLPRSTHRSLRRLAVLGVAGATALSVTGLGAASGTTAPAASSTAVRHHHVHTPAGVHGSRIDAALQGVHGKVTVMLQMDVRPAVRAYTHAQPRGQAHARVASREQSARIASQQRSVAAHFSSPRTKARELYRVHATYAGIAVRTSASHLNALAHLDGVKAIHRIVLKSPSLTATDPLIGAPAAWNNTGFTGAGVTVGIIDTGLDYTHADFGGPGTTAAYDDALANDTLPVTYPDPAKVGGGVDFVGDSYDPGGEGGVEQPIPHPDTNPLDCEGHGTHVAGITAGYGELSNGDAYAGPYDGSLTADNLHDNFLIGPGVAPKAQLFPIRIFGCTGDSAFVAEGVDWAADPNGDGDLSDHLDVVNMSLGVDYASPDDVDAVAVNNASKAGIAMAVAMGNGRDIYEIGGSPGNAVRAIAAAASDDSSNVADEFTVVSPPSIAGDYPSEESIAYDWKNDPGVTNQPLAEIGDWSQPPSGTNNIDGCDELSTADAAAVAGKVAFLWWTDDDAARRCGSAARSANVKAAGAAGALFGSDTRTWSAGITGDEDIPVMLTNVDTRDAIQGELSQAHAVNVTMTNALHNQGFIDAPENVDKVIGFSSRGMTAPGNIKPDVTAPGVSIFSAGVGTGDEGLVESGTSMASPQVAGTAVLVRQAHPKWSPEKVKAAIMNTAGSDLFTGDNQTGKKYAPERVGAGRIQVDSAVATRALAYNANGSGSVSVSFGVINAPSKMTLTRKIKVVNTRTLAPEVFDISYSGIDRVPGARLSVSPAQLSLPGGGSGTVTVTLTIRPTLMPDRPDPTINLDPLGVGLTRSFYSDVSGRVLVTPEDSGPELRVPVFAAPRPASTLSQAKSVQLTGGKVKTGTLTIHGTGISNLGGPSDGIYLSQVDAFELQGTSAKLPACTTTRVSECVGFPDERAGDLRSVGFASDGPAFKAAGLRPKIDGAFLYFGVQTDGPWRTPASYTEYDINIDVDGDNVPDAVVYNTRLGETDIMVAELATLNPDGSLDEVLDDELLNNLPGDVDTDLFHSDVLTMPVFYPALAQAGLVSLGSTRIHWWVDSFGIESGFLDSIGEPEAGQKPMSVDVLNPRISATAKARGNCLVAVDPASCPTVIVDDDGVKLTVREDTRNTKDTAHGLLLFHHYNVDGKRAQVVGLAHVA